MNLKKILALVLVLAMLVSMVPTYAFAEDVELWDEEEVAVQDDAALEDVYLDEEPEEVIVEDEPEATEPEAVEVEEPAAEEPATAVAEAVAVEETNDFDAADTVAMVMSNGRMCASFAEAVSVASNTDIIVMMQNDTSSTPVTIQKKLTVYPGLASASIAARLIVSGELTLQNMTTTAIDVITGGKLTIATGDTGSYGTVSDARGSETTGFISGGTFTSLSKTLLAGGAFAENVIDENTVSGRVQIAAARVAYKESGTSVDYTTKGTAYGTLAEAVTEALRAETGKTKVLVILTNPADTDKIELKAGETLNIYYKTGVNLPEKFITAATNCYFDPTPTAHADSITTYNCKGYQAMWHMTSGATRGIQTAKYFINYSCIYGDGYVEFFVKPESKVTLKAPDDTHKTVKVTVVDNEFAPDIAAPGKYALKVDKTTESGKIIYELVEAVASYEKPTTADPKTTEKTYTATFNEAATKAAELATDHKFAVELYKAPSIEGTTKDTYTMTEAGVLTVKKATETDILAHYEKFVVGGTGVSVTAELSGDKGTATYTATAAKARIDIPNENPKYFPSFQDAAQYIASSEYEARKDLIITVLAEDTWEISESWKPYPIKVNEGLAKITINSTGAVYAKGTDATGCTLYTVIDATASYVNADGKTVYTDNFSKAATEAAKNPDKNGAYEVKLYKFPNLVATETQPADIFTMSAGTLTVTPDNTSTIGNTWTAANAAKIVKGAENVAVTATFNNTSKVATFTAAAAVARIDYNGEDPAFFGNITAAINAAKGHENLVITLLDNIPETVLTAAMATTETTKQVFNINDNGFEISLKAPANTLDAAKKHVTTAYELVKTPSESANYTTYELKKATVYVVTEDYDLDKNFDKIPGSNFKGYASFADAAKAAAGTQTIALLADVGTAAAPYILGSDPAVTKVIIDPKGDGSNVKTLNIIAAEGTGLKTSPDAPSTGLTTYSTTTPVASVDFGTATTPDVRYYGTFAEAAAAAVTLGKNVVILAEIAATDTYALAKWGTLKVETNNFDVTVTAAGNVNNTDWAYAIDKSTADGVTTFKSVSAVASVDLGTETAHDVHYYATFADAVKAAAGTKRITLLKTFTQENPGQTARKVEYALGATDAAEQLIVDLYGNTLTVTSAVDGKSVNITSERDTTLNRMINTYKLNNPAAYVMDGETNLGYFDTFAQAAAKALVNADAAQNTKKVVLMANVEADYKLPVDKQINIETGDYTVNVVPTHKIDKTTTPATTIYYAVDWSLNDGVYNFKSVPAVAYIDYSRVSLKTGDIEYYATFAEAAQHAYVFGEDKPTLTVVVLKQPAVADPDDPTVIADLFEVSEAGSILIDKSAETSTNKINVEPNFDMADGLAYDYESKGNNVFLVKIVEAEAYTIKNNGELEYYADVADACVLSNGTAGHPVVYLLQDGLKYELAKNATIRVNKNGHDDFLVTKTERNNASANYRYAIVETVDGSVSTYTTTDDVVAYINFETTQDVEGSDYDQQTVNDYVFYHTFKEAAEAAHGEKTIFLTRAMTDEKDAYTLAADETLIVNETSSNFAMKIYAPEGSALKDTETEGQPKLHTFTVEACVAVVTGRLDPSKPNEKVDVYFADLAEALKVAIANYDTGDGVLTLKAAVPEDFVYPLAEKDMFTVTKSDDYKFSAKNFSTPDGLFVTTKEWTSVIDYSLDEIMASIGEGDDIQYFNTFKAAVDAAVKIEKDAGRYGDEFNPSTVITLYANNTVPFELVISARAGEVKTLLLNAGEFKTGLSVGTDEAYFLEKIPTEQEGVFKYQKSKLVATVESGPINARVTTKYSSFAAAAEAALNTVEMVKLNVAQTELEADDIFEMPAGTLRVYLDSSKITSFANLQRDHIKVKGEKLFINSEWITDGHYQLFTVTGAVASITTPQGTAFYYDMAQAVAAAKNHANMVIVPLTDIDCYLPDTAGIDGDFFNVADSEYDVQIRAKGYELAHEGTKYTFKDAVAYVTTDDVLSVDPATNEPTFIDQYFSKIEDAIEFAEGKMLITLLQDVEYEFHDASTVAIIALTTKDATGATATHKFNRTVADKLEGYVVKDTVIKEADPRTAKYELAALQTLTFEAGDGEFVDGNNKASQLTFKAYAGVSFTGLRALETGFTPYDAYQAGGKLTLEGYHVAYLKGSDGNNYALNTSGTLTPDEKAAGYVLLPTTMPEGGLTLTAVWEGNEYWVVFREAGTDSFIAETKATYGELITVPEKAEVKDHYDFAGWFTDLSAKSSSAFDIANTKLLNTDGKTLIDLTAGPAAGTTWSAGGSHLFLYGKFNEKTYTVKFVTDCDVVIPEQRVKYNENVTSVDSKLLIRDGYEFKYWFTKDEDGNEIEWNFGNSKVTGDTTIYAKWNAIPMTIYWADGDTVLATSTDNVGATITAPVLDSENNQIAKREKAGYRLDTENMWADFDGTVHYNEKRTIIYQLNWIEQIPVLFLDGGKKLGQISVDKDSHLADAKDVPAPTKEGYTLVWQLEGEDYDMSAPIQEELILTASWVEGEDVSKYATVVSSLSLNNNINLNAYVTIKENTVPGDYEVKVEFNGKTMMEGTLDTVGTYVASTNEYRLADIAVIAAPQMNDAATVTITYQGQEVLSKDLSVRAYAEEWIEKSDDDELAEMLKSLLDFGAYSQILFNYETDNLVNSKYSTGKVPTTTVPVYNITKDGSVTGINGVSPSLTLVSNTSLNMYFSVAKKNSKIAFSVDGKAAPASYKAKEYRVEKAGINIVNLDKEIVYTATLGDETFTVSAAPLAYAYMHQNDGDGLGEVCKAVYQYYLAAVEYFS